MLVTGQSLDEFTARAREAIRIDSETLHTDIPGLCRHAETFGVNLNASTDLSGNSF
jgi:hypothetical protein